MQTILNLSGSDFKQYMLDRLPALIDKSCSALKSVPGVTIDVLVKIAAILALNAIELIVEWMSDQFFWAKGGAKTRGFFRRKRADTEPSQRFWVMSG